MSSVQLQLLARVLAKADVSMVKNRFLIGQETAQNPDLQPINTYALTTAPSSPYTRFYDAASIHASSPAVAPWNVYGGDPTVHTGSGSISGVRADCLTSDISTTPHAKSAQDSVFEFMLDGGDMVIKFEQNHDFRLLIEEDGVMKIAMAGLGAAMQTGTGWAYYTYNFDHGFGSLFKHRKIQIQPLINNPNGNTFDVGLFGGIYVQDNCQVFAPRQEPLRVCVMHDSHGQGRNGPSADGIWGVCFNMLGIKDVRNLSIGSTGAIARLWPDTYGRALGYYSDRRGDVTGANPDIAVIPVSWNDYDEGHALGWTGSTGMTAIVAAMNAEILAYKAANPDMIIIVPGLMDTHEYLTVEPDAISLNSAIKAMIVALADSSIVYIDLNAMYESPWTGVTANDNMVGSPPVATPVGNYALMYANPPDHPLPYGDYAWGTALANRILEALEALNKVTVGDYIPPPITYGNWTHVVNESDSPNTFTVTSPTGVAYRFGNASLNQWSPDTFLSPGTYSADWHTWPTDPSPGHAKEVQIGTPL